MQAFRVLASAEFCTRRGLPCLLVEYWWLISEGARQDPSGTEYCTAPAKHRMGCHGLIKNNEPEICVNRPL